MAKSFLPDGDGQVVEKKNSRQLLLVLLLLILAFVYLYFFTGLIKPRPEGKAPEPAQTPAMQVKRPLPPRPAQTAQTPPKPEAPPQMEVAQTEHPAPAAAPGKEPAAAKAQPHAAPAPGAKPAPAAPAAAAKPAPAAPSPLAKAAQPAKTAQPAAKPAPAPAKVAPVAKAPQPATKAAQPAKSAAAQPAKGAHNGAAPAKGGKEGKPAQVAAEQGAKTQAHPAEGGEGKGKAAVAPTRAAYAVEIGDLPESEVDSVVAKVKKAGISKVVKNKVKKGEPMHRLFLADFADHAEAKEELDRLKAVAPSAFLLPENGRYAVYAGSYLREKKAALEQDRLFDLGVKLLLKSATAPVAVTKVRAGAFPDRASAEKAARALKGSGITGQVVKAQQ